MKRFLALAILVFIGVATWQIGSKLSADALGMGVGILFGIMAGIPTALLLLASNRHRDRDDGHGGRSYGRAQQGHFVPYGHYPQQPPVIVLAGGQPTPQQGHAYAARGQHEPIGLLEGGHTIESRDFRVVGARETIVEDW